MVAIIGEDDRYVKIAITADNHLTTREKHPERFQSLENIYQQCRNEGVQLLIIAGDLFDQSLANYHAFEDLHQDHRYPDLTTVVIPGNHDRTLSAESVRGDGLIIYSEPTIQPLNDSRKLFFLPYQPEKTMGEIIASKQAEIEGDRWILISHGDWLPGISPPDPNETGIYMPLSRKDLQLFRPELAFLGHIHLHQEDSPVHIPGSPCPLDISETGLRRFFILDTDSGQISTHRVDAPLLYFDETLLLLPTEAGLEKVLDDIQKLIAGWDLPDDWTDRVQIRIKIQGVSDLNRQAIFDEISQAFSDFRFYKDQGPDLSNLFYDTDPDRAEISKLFTNWLEENELASTPPGQPTEDQIIQAAFEIIYEVR